MYNIDKIRAGTLFIKEWYEWYSILLVMNKGNYLRIRCFDFCKFVKLLMCFFYKSLLHMCDLCPPLPLPICFDEWYSLPITTQSSWRCSKIWHVVYNANKACCYTLQSPICIRANIVTFFQQRLCITTKQIFSSVLHFQYINKLIKYMYEKLNKTDILGESQ